MNQNPDSTPPAPAAEPRRSFLGTLASGSVLLLAAAPVGAALALAARTALAPAKRSGGGIVPVCNRDEVPTDGVLTRSVQFWVRHGAFQEQVELPVYLRRDGEAIVALSSECTHLGCPVHHVPGERKFHCPCHGGVFDENGAVEAGPPPAPLRRFEVAPIEEDGVVRLVVNG